MAREELVETQEVVAFGAIGIIKTEAAHGIRFAALEFFLNLVWGIEQVNPAHFRGIRLGHFFGAISQAHHPRPCLLDCRFRDFQYRGIVAAKLVINAQGNVAGEFDVLFLVFAHGDAISIVEQDIRSHQHGVIEQPHAHVLALFHGFFLELDHAL